MTENKGKIKIMSWNINGMRTSKDSVKELLNSLDCDVLCLQETKLTRDQLDEETAILNGFNSYYSFSRVKGGYSGVATICKNEFAPISAEEGLSGVNHTLFSNEKDIVGQYGDILDNFTKDELIALDSEGRSVVTKHKIRSCDGKEEFLAIINVYCPHASLENDDRLKFKYQFFELLEQRAKSLLDNGSNVIILGDLNAIHKEIDSGHTIEFEKFTKGREWLDNLVEDTNGGEIPVISGEMKFIDTFRHCHPARKEAFTCWSTRLSARTLNFGTRLDYILANVNFAKRTLDSGDIHPEVQGSDHCPVTAQFNCEPIAAKTCPFLCTKNWPEFAGKQQSLKSFFQKVDKTNSLEKQNSSPPKKKQKTVNSNQKTLSSFFKKTDSAIQKTSSQNNSQEEPKQNSCAEESNPETSSQNSQEESKQNSDTVNKWKNLFKKNNTVPLCSGHKEPCVLRTVKKSGANYGRQFYMCARTEGPKTNPLSRCNFFNWK